MGTFRSGPMARTIAHRGGSGIAPENTIEAFGRAHRMGVRTMELDVHLTLDGELVVIHDETLERTTDGRGAVAEARVAELVRLDAGYRFVDGRGKTPYAGRGLRIPTFREVVTTFPDVFFVVELKPVGDGIARAIRGAIDAMQVHDRVCVAGFDEATLARFRALPGRRTRTSGGRSIIRNFLVASSLRLEQRVRWPFDMLQVPLHHDGIPVVTRRFADALHGVGAELHVWTLDDRDVIERTLSVGADAIITDRPDRMADLG